MRFNLNDLTVILILVAEHFERPVAGRELRNDEKKSWKID